jgi:hypothetical protein
MPLAGYALELVSAALLELDPDQQQFSSPNQAATNRRRRRIRDSSDEEPV